MVWFMRLIHNTKRKASGIVLPTVRCRVEIGFADVIYINAKNTANTIDS
jgi:hypothetical protein